MNKWYLVLHFDWDEAEEYRNIEVNATDRVDAETVGNLMIAEIPKWLFAHVKEVSMVYGEEDEEGYGYTGWLDIADNIPLYYAEG